MIFLFDSYRAVDNIFFSYLFILDMYQMQIVFFYFLIKYNGSKLNLFEILRGETEVYVWQNSGSEESRFEL